MLTPRQDYGATCVGVVTLKGEFPIQLSNLCHLISPRINISKAFSNLKTVQKMQLTSLAGKNVLHSAIFICVAPRITVPFNLYKKRHLCLIIIYLFF